MAEWQRRKQQKGQLKRLAVSNVTYYRRRSTTPHSPGVSAGQLSIRSSRYRRLVKVTAGLVGLTVIILLFISSKIDQVIVEGPEEWRPQVQQKSEELLKKGTHFAWFFEEAAFARTLAEAVPEAGEIRVSIRLTGGKLLVIFKGRTPSLIWQSRGVQWVVGDDGVVLRIASDHDLAQLPLVFDESAIPIEPGVRVAPAGFTQFTQEVHQLLQAAALQPVSYEVKSSIREIEVRFNNQPFAVHFDTTRTAGEQVSELILLLENLRQTKQRLPQQYIDLRLSRRAYYQ